MLSNNEEKAYDNIQHPSMTKTILKIGRRKFLQLDKERPSTKTHQLTLFQIRED